MYFNTIFKIRDHWSTFKEVKSYKVKKDEKTGAEKHTLLKKIPSFNYFLLFQ